MEKQLKIDAGKPKKANRATHRAANRMRAVHSCFKGTKVRTQTIGSPTAAHAPVTPFYANSQEPGATWRALANVGGSANAGLLDSDGRGSTPIYLSTHGRATMVPNR